MARTRIRIDQADGDDFLSEEEAEETFVAKAHLPYKEGSLFLDGYLAFGNFYDADLGSKISNDQMVLFNCGGIPRIIANGKEFDLNAFAESGSLTPKLYSGSEELFCSNAILHYERINRLVFVSGSLSWELQGKRTFDPLFIHGLPFKPLEGSLWDFSLAGSRGIKKRSFCIIKQKPKLLTNKSQTLSLKKVLGDDYHFALTTKDLKNVGTIRFKGFYISEKKES